MRIFNSILYKEDIEKVASLAFPWYRLKEKTILISGATGLIGSFLIDVIMHLNKSYDLRCTVYALARNMEKAKMRFEYCYDASLFRFVPYDITRPLKKNEIGKVDYVLHLASNTHPIAYATDPIGTITTNIIGTQNMFEFAFERQAVRSVFASSNEIYGENREDIEKFDESYCGYIDCNTLRAGYPESKRCGEALCQAYISQKGMDIVIPRLTRSYGPTMLIDDTKAIAQFIRKAVAGENIVLKSMGTQFYSYTYVADAVSGLLTVLFYGKKGNAYNISDNASDIMLKDLASIIAATVNKEVIFEQPDAIEAAGYSKSTKARLDGKKIEELGWKPFYNIANGVQRTIKILNGNE